MMVGSTERIAPPIMKPIPASPLKRETAQMSTPRVASTTPIENDSGAKKLTVEQNASDFQPHQRKARS
ncbi:MAG: hypothetical protein DI585_04350 [Pseudomonas fluorescens]|nr:MAG: hypothetical protein DI585_04350 [Pseudomonas fluorescens]